jgi:hypothetical protein
MKEQIELNNGLINKFEALYYKKLNLDNNIEELNNEKAKKIAFTKHLVFSETDENGKKKYTNEDMRSFALNNLLESDPEYQETVTKYKETSLELNRIKAEIEITSKKINVNLKNSDLLIALGGLK